MPIELWRNATVMQGVIQIDYESMPLDSSFRGNSHSRIFYLKNNFIINTYIMALQIIVKIWWTVDLYMFVYISMGIRNINVTRQILRGNRSEKVYHFSKLIRFYCVDLTQSFLPALAEDFLDLRTYSDSVDNNLELQNSPNLNT